jgi:hypothetical protein
VEAGRCSHDGVLSADRVLGLPAKLGRTLIAERKKGPDSRLIQISTDSTSDV